MSAPTFTPATPHDRAAVVALVARGVLAGFEMGRHSGRAVESGDALMFAEELVRPVPMQPRRVRTQFGEITYNPAMCRWENVVNSALFTYACAVDAACGCWPASADRDAIHAQLMDLKANPTEPAAPVRVALSVAQCLAIYKACAQRALSATSRLVTRPVFEHESVAFVRAALDGAT